MDQANLTPGRWEYAATLHASPSIVALDAFGPDSTPVVLAVIPGTEHDPEIAANGRAMAAAKDLLAALREITAMVACNYDATVIKDDPAWERARAALARATSGGVSARPAPRRDPVEEAERRYLDETARAWECGSRAYGEQDY